MHKRTHIISSIMFIHITVICNVILTIKYKASLSSFVCTILEPMKEQLPCTFTKCVHNILILLCIHSRVKQLRTHGISCVCIIISCVDSVFLIPVIHVMLIIAVKVISKCSIQIRITCHISKYIKLIATRVTPLHSEYCKIAYHRFR